MSVSTINYRKIYRSKFQIPQEMVGPLRRYVEEHTYPGGFLEAVICGDLLAAVSRGDNDSLENLVAFVMFFYNEVPSECWGSKDKMYDWLKKGESNGNS